VTAYTVKTLASEWCCSEGVIRKMIKRGDLRCIRLGDTLIRIPAEEVRRFECQNIPCSGSEGDGQSSTPTNTGSVSDASYMRPIGLGPRQRHDPAGGRMTRIGRSG
jgi:excisionase family DNA binding protein